MSKSTLFLTAGHGGSDRGNTAVAGLVERDETIAIVSGMRAWFVAYGIPSGVGGAVFLPDALDLAGQLQRLKLWRLNEADGDLALDFHLDYAANRPSGGAMVIINRYASAQMFADRFLARWCAATGIRSNGIHYGDVVAPLWRGFTNFGHTAQPWPAAIVELGSLNNAGDMATVRNPVTQALAAQFVYEAWRA